MAQVILPPPVLITNTDSEIFIKAISKALSSLAPDDLRTIYLFNDQAVVISFSSDYQPFIGFTTSYNDPDNRLYIYPYSYVLTRIAKALDMQGRDMPGGRVFTEKKYSYIKDSEFHHQVILIFDWQGDDPYLKIKDAYKKLLG